MKGCKTCKYSKEYNPVATQCWSTLKAIATTGNDRTILVVSPADETDCQFYTTTDKDKVKRLQCCCCGASTHGRQWYNRDNGYGLCRKCADWIEESGKETPDMMQSYYGIRGLHYDIKGLD